MIKQAVSFKVVPSLIGLLDQLKKNHGEFCPRTKLNGTGENVKKKVFPLIALVLS